MTHQVIRNSVWFGFFSFSFSSSCFSRCAFIVTGSYLPYNSAEMTLLPSILQFNSIHHFCFCFVLFLLQVYHQNSPSSSHQIYGNVLNTSLTNLGYASSWHTSGDYGMFQNSYHYQTPEYLPIGDLRYSLSWMKPIAICFYLIDFVFDFCFRASSSYTTSQMADHPPSMHPLSKAEPGSPSSHSLYNQNNQSPETITTLECSSRSPNDKTNQAEQQHSLQQQQQPTNSADEQRLTRNNSSWEPLTPPQ